MSTDYEGPFKKLFENVSDSWLMIPLRLRGIGDEIMRYANRQTGKVADSRATLPLLRKLGADRSDAADLEEALEALLAQGFLSLDESGALYVTNLVKAQSGQRSKWREQKQGQRKREDASAAAPMSAMSARTSVDIAECPPVRSGPQVSTPVHPCPQMSAREERRGDQSRGDQIPPTPRPPVPDDGPEPSRATDPVTCPPDLTLPAEVVSQLEQQGRIPAQIEWLTVDLRGKWLAQGTKRRPAEWVQYLRGAVSRTLSDSAERKRIAAAIAARGETGDPELDAARRKREERARHEASRRPASPAEVLRIMGTALATSAPQTPASGQPRATAGAS